MKVRAMIAFKEFEDGVTFFEQFPHSDGPVVIIDILIAPAGKRDEVLAAWTTDANDLVHDRARGA